MNSVGVFVFMGMIFTTKAVFKDYCTPGLCKWTGGDGKHTGCKDGVPFNGKLQGNCSQGAYLIDVDAFNKKLILDTHNDRRNHVAGGGLIPDGINSACRIGAVTWDEELRFTAELHAKHCFFAHDDCRNTIKYPMTGQNLAIVKYDSFKKLNVTERNILFMNAWYDEYKDVKQDVIDHYKSREKGAPMVGHFFTMVNERGNRLGCSSIFNIPSKDKHEYMLSCNYAATSIKRATIYNSCKQPGLKCTSGRDPKYRNLCSVKEDYNYDGLLDFIPYDATVVDAKEDSKEVDEAKVDEEVDKKDEEEAKKDEEEAKKDEEAEAKENEAANGYTKNNIWYYFLSSSIVICMQNNLFA